MVHVIILQPIPECDLQWNFNKIVFIQKLGGHKSSPLLFCAKIFSFKVLEIMVHSEEIFFLPALQSFQI